MDDNKDIENKNEGENSIKEEDKMNATVLKKPMIIQSENTTISAVKVLESIKKVNDKHSKVMGMLAK